MIKLGFFPRSFLFVPARPRLAIKRYVFAVAVLALANLACYLGENFHTVVNDKVYRSAQLGSDSLESHITREGVRSVINLRGSNPGREWYQQECAVAMRNGVRHFDVPIDSDFAPSGQELIDLVRVLKSCPKPVLMHCQSGIDRSGVAAAISVLLLDPEGSLDKALDQLSLRFGHMPWKANWARQYAFVHEYGAWLAQRELLHSPAHFQQWLALAGAVPAQSLRAESEPRR
jgi:protein tyrosine phosphatase (PTP) superfamily phosphohydrolase (DUF442 family)